MCNDSSVTQYAISAELLRSSPIVRAESVQPSYLRPTYVLPGRTAQLRAATAFFGIRPAVLPSSCASGHARTHTHTRARENLGRTVGRLDGFKVVGR